MNERNVTPEQRRAIERWENEGGKACTPARRHLELTTSDERAQREFIVDRRRE
jgi:hypothetical protein